MDLGLLEKVAAVVIGINVVLSAVASVLDYLKGVVKSDAIDKADGKVHSILSGIKNIVDWLSANQKH